MNYPTRTWLEIDRHAFHHNINCYHTILAPQKTNISVVIKSNAYGHGLREIAQLCQENNQVTYLCVVLLSEALTLRAQGIRKQILVLGIIDADPEIAIKQQIELVVYDIETIKKLHNIAAHLQMPCIIHLKVDTGMGRLGILPDKVLTIVQYIKTLPFIELKGICSHFAESSNNDLQFTQQQCTTFQQVLRQLKQNNIMIPCRHISNSAGSTAINISGLNLVRIGAGAYGMIPSQSNYALSCQKNDGFSLIPILSWHTRIMHIRTISAGKPIGYDRTFITSKETTIALLPIGYADGYSRRLSNTGYVFLKKQHHFSPVIGRVAMNFTTIDITGVNVVEIDDEVLVLGKEKLITPNALATYTGCHNPRVMTTQINGNIARMVTESEVGTTYEIPYTKNTQVRIDENVKKG